MKAIACAIALTLVSTFAMADTQWKSTVRIMGQCKYRLFREAPYVDCDPNLLYGTLSSGRVVFIFTSTSPGRKTTYTFSGGSDRQPRLEDYYLSIDKFRMILTGLQPDTIEVPYEGECHMHSDKSGLHIRLLECDGFNRQAGQGTSLRVTDATAVRLRTPLRPTNSRTTRLSTSFPTGLQFARTDCVST